MMRFVLFSTTVVAWASLAQAQTAPSPDVLSPGAAGLEGIVVSATRSPQPIYKVGSSITVLDQRVLTANQMTVVSDLLGQTPGITTSRNGGIGGVTAVRIRGAEADQTVVIVDGVKLNDPSAPGSGYNFANLLASDIERIEILRGAQSVLWGSQAIGGVVSILTTQPSRPFAASVEAEGGSFGTLSMRGGMGGATDRVVWRLAGSHYTTDGVSAFNRGREDDGYRNTGASGRLRLDVSDNISLDARAVYTDARNDADGFPAPTFAFADTNEYGTNKELVGYAGINVAAFRDRLKNRVAFTYTDTDRNTFNPAQTPTTVTFDGQGKNKRWEYQGALAVTDGVSAIFGVEDEKSSFRTASPSSFNPNPVPAVAKVGLTSVYGQIAAGLAPGVTVTAGARNDDHDTFGSHATAQANIAWALNDGATVIRASYGEGFKAPSLYQLYSDYGNTRLKPEVAETWDAGIEQHLLDNALTLGLIGFKRAVKNQIDFAGCPGNPNCRPASFGVYDNIARARAKGVEVSMAATMSQVALQASYTYTDTENTSPGNANFGRTLARRPKNTANASAFYTWPHDIETGVRIRYVGDSFDNAANSFVLEDYTVVDVLATAPLTDTVEMYGRIENVFDKTYTTTRNYGAPGAGGFVGVRARF